MRVIVEQGELVDSGWFTFHIFDNDGRELVLKRNDVRSLTKFLSVVLQLDEVERFVCTSPDELVIEGLIDAIHDLLHVGPCDPCYEEECGGANRCTRGKDGEPCSCHEAEEEAQLKAQAVVNKAQGR